MTDLQLVAIAFTAGAFVGGVATFLFCQLWPR